MTARRAAETPISCAGGAIGHAQHARKGSDASGTRLRTHLHRPLHEHVSVLEYTNTNTKYTCDTGCNGEVAGVRVRRR